MEAMISIVRVLFTVATINNQCQIVLLEHVINHRYSQSKFLRYSGVTFTESDFEDCSQVLRSSPKVAVNFHSPS